MGKIVCGVLSVTVFSATIASVLAACTGDDPVLVVTTPDRADASMQDGPSGETTPDAGGDATSVCKAPALDCDGDGTCETTVTTDSDNCGACGHACGGGTCVDGRCQPTVIASSLHAPVSVGVNSTGVFWIQNELTAKCPKTGCVGDPTRLAGNTKVTSGRTARQMFVNESDVYWLGYETVQGQAYVFRCGTAGCGLSPTAIGDYAGAGVLIGNTAHVLRFDPTGSLMRWKLDGSGVTYLTKLYQSEAHSFATDGDTLAFSNLNAGIQGQGGVWTGSISADSTPTKLMDTGKLVAIGGGVVYATRDLSGTESVVFACPVTGCGGGGNPLTPAGKAEGTISDIVVTKTAVVWTTRGTPGKSDGQVRACALPSCAGGPQTLADGQAAPVALAVDDEFVYWANEGTGASGSGSIARVRLLP